MYNYFADMLIVVWFCYCMTKMCYSEWTYFTFILSSMHVPLRMPVFTDNHQQWRQEDREQKCRSWKRKKWTQICQWQEKEEVKHEPHKKVKKQKMILYIAIITITEMWRKKKKRVKQILNNKKRKDAAIHSRTKKRKKEKKLQRINKSRYERLRWRWKEKYWPTSFL